MTERARTLFLGSGSFAVPIAEALADHPSVDLMTVVTAPTRRGSRGRPTDPPVADWAAVRGLPMLRPALLRAPESIATIAELMPDLLVLADYGQIVPSALLELPRHGALNLHPSLLPRHRGASPIPTAIIEGDKEIGVSLMLMDAGLDTGPIIAQTRRDLGPWETAPQLEIELANAAAGLLLRELDDWLRSKLVATPQLAEGATLTRLLRREDGRLDPRRGMDFLKRQLRAYRPWPGTFIETPTGRIVVWDADSFGEDPPGDPGTLIRLAGSGLGLVASDGLLHLTDVQPAGGRRMSGADLLRGRPELAGSIVTTPSAASPTASA